MVNLKNKIISKLHEFKKSKFRSPKWDEVRDEFVKNNPACAACGCKTNIQVHHMKPFHLYPEMELDVSNLISLCMADNDCHLKIGHGGSFKCYNPNVEADCLKHMTASIDERKLIVEEVKKNRLI